MTTQGAKPTNAMTRDELIAHMREMHDTLFSPGVRTAHVDDLHVHHHKDAADGYTALPTPHVHRGDI